MLTRLGPVLAIGLLTLPVAFGLAGTVLPAFGYLPALGGKHFSLDPFAVLATEPALFASAGMSLVAGLGTALVSLTVVMLFTAAWVGTPAFRRMERLLSPLLSVPHAAAAFALAFLIAPSGLVARIVSPELTGWQRPPDILIVNDPMGLSMMAGLVVKEIPFLLLMTLAALPQARPVRTRALVASMGYGRVAGFVFGLWPVIYPQIRLPVFAVIAFASSVVDVAAILGPTAPAPLAVRLVGWMSDPDLSMRFLASAGALLQLVVTALAIAIWIGLEKAATGLRDRFAFAGVRLRCDGMVRAGALAMMLTSAAIIFAGLAALALWSVAGLWPFPDAMPASYSLRTWMRALPQLRDPMLTTLAAAFASSAVAVVIAILCLAHEDRMGHAPGRWAFSLIYLPLLVPQVAFLFGLQLLFVLAGVEATMPALMLAHLVFVLPYAYLGLKDPWRAFDRRYDQLAAGLGKRAWLRFLHIRLPMLARPILAVMAVGFAVSVGLYLPTVLIGAGRLTTVTTEAVALASGGNRRVIGVYAFMQMFLPVLGFAVATLVPALIFRRFRDMQY
ncbi:putative permease ABC transporter protein [Nitratireductor indicus C115]|uniref:Putative permease ABC transporter protein n=1 Tax=Nitratireductor indicus C115 TaxID=1231190 RepID=K2PTR3_9HYPH|nr:ABC transporter permease subunit [Nitratireductor indicus]EKF44472.1 putative permease ABC transporter protein [Nitratireductor indicus C115]SFQ30052.1 putative thiamine transport system permease protein [Nitratireductor indicus]